VSITGRSGRLQYNTSQSSCRSYTRLTINRAGQFTYLSPIAASFYVCLFYRTTNRQLRH